MAGTELREENLAEGRSSVHVGQTGARVKRHKDRQCTKRGPACRSGLPSLSEGQDSEGQQAELYVRWETRDVHTSTSVGILSFLQKNKIK